MHGREVRREKRMRRAEEMIARVIKSRYRTARMEKLRIFREVSEGNGNCEAGANNRPVISGSLTSSWKISPSSCGKLDHGKPIFNLNEPKIIKKKLMDRFLVELKYNSK